MEAQRMLRCRQQHRWHCAQVPFSAPTIQVPLPPFKMETKTTDTNYWCLSFPAPFLLAKVAPGSGPLLGITRCPLTSSHG